MKVRKLYYLVFPSIIILSVCLFFFHPSISEIKANFLFEIETLLVGHKQNKPYQFKENTVVGIKDKKGDLHLAKIKGRGRSSKANLYLIALEEKGIPKTFKVTKENQIIKVITVPLQQVGNTSRNNHLLEMAFHKAGLNPGSIIALPKGTFQIGSHNPMKHYLIIPSHTSLIGNKTQLIIDGAEYWFGLATGPNASDGVQYFTMTGLQFQAKDLVHGNQLLIMTDHGAHWTISKNSFTLVHKRGNHIFDLGSLQDSNFKDNQFYGYAPDLGDVKFAQKDHNMHDFYAEAIQLDAAESSGIWDAGYIRSIEPKSKIFNHFHYVSNNISIINNAFLPYFHHGKLIAYGASIGQHSSKVGKVTIDNNLFEDTLVTKFTNGDWLMKPIHLLPASSVSIYNNVFK